MKFTTAAIVLGLAAAVNAQAACDPIASKVPSCAVPCISSAGAGVGCADHDYKCQCSASQSAAIQSAAQGCVISKCGLATGAQVIASAAAVCSCAATAGAPSSASASATSAPSSAPASDTGSASLPVETTLSPSGSGGYPTGGESVTSVPSSYVPTMTDTVISEAPTSAPASPSQSIITGGGAAVAGSLGGIMGAMLLAIVAL